MYVTELLQRVAVVSIEKILLILQQQTCNMAQRDINTEDNHDLSEFRVTFLQN
jgi:hypothetical protein